MNPWLSGSSQALSPSEVRDTWLNPRYLLRDMGWHFQDNLGLLELCAILGEEGAAGVSPPTAARQAALAVEQVGSWGSSVSNHLRCTFPNSATTGI